MSNKPSPQKRKNQAPANQMSNKPKSNKEKYPPNRPFDLWEETFSRYLPGVFYVSLFLTIVLGVYLFDVKISSGGDDSDYILSTKKFLEGREFPSWHGSFYPIFLGLPYIIFGVDIIVMKITSFLFIVGHLVFLYLAFRNKLPSLLLSLILLSVSVNSSMLYFASQTYSEALYLFIQVTAFLVFFKILDSIKDTSDHPKVKLHLWLLLGFMMVLFAITRPVGYAMIITVLFYFLITRNFLSALYSFLYFLFYYIPFSLYKWIFWGIVPGRSSGRVEEIFYKNLYNKAAGFEDFNGMVTRFVDNCNLYLSKHFPKIIGLKAQESTEIQGFITLLVIGILLLSLFMAFRRKNKYMTTLALYLGCSISITFITLQQSWDQMRMILIYVPFILILAAWGVFEFFISVKKKGLSLLVVLILVFVFFGSLADTSHMIKQNQKVLSKNLRGNLYYGFTPDWQNFLKMSEWVGKNIPDSAVVASRKPSMSFIYSKGKEFYAIYRFPTEDPDSIILRLEARTGPLLALKQNELYDKKIPFQQQLLSKPGIVAVVSQEQDLYTLHQAAGPTYEPLAGLAQQYKLNLIGTDSLRRILHKKNKPDFGISPDTLLNALLDSRVEYLIAASLRAIPSAKTERIINTVQRHMFMIEMKYPGIFTQVHQIGDNEGEPALLYKVNYDRYGFHLPKP
jgi:hypothetical protein